MLLAGRWPLIHPLKQNEKEERRKWTWNVSWGAGMSRGIIYCGLMLKRGDAGLVREMDLVNSLSRFIVCWTVFTGKQSPIRSTLTGKEASVFLSWLYQVKKHDCWLGVHRNALWTEWQQVWNDYYSSIGKLNIYIKTLIKKENIYPGSAAFRKFYSWILWTHIS